MTRSARASVRHPTIAACSSLRSSALDIPPKATNAIFHKQNAHPQHTRQPSKGPQKPDPPRLRSRPDIPLSRWPAVVILVSILYSI